MKLLIAIAAAAAALAGVAHAESAPSDPWRVYASGGYTYAHASISGTDINVGALTGRLGARYGANLGVEAEGSFGVADDSIGGVNIKLNNQYAVYAVGYLPVSPEWDLLARIGYGRAKVSVSGGGVSGSSEGNTWNVGVGAQYNFGGHSAVRGEYTRLESTESGGGHFDTATLSYVYRF